MSDFLLAVKFFWRGVALLAVAAILLVLSWYHFTGDYSAVGEKDFGIALFEAIFFVVAVFLAGYETGVNNK